MHRHNLRLWPQGLHKWKLHLYAVLLKEGEPVHGKPAFMRQQGSTGSGVHRHSPHRGLESRIVAKEKPILGVPGHRGQQHHSAYIPAGGSFETGGSQGPGVCIPGVGHQNGACLARYSLGLG